MWMLIRGAAIAVLVVVGMLVAGRGASLLGALDVALGAIGAGPIPTAPPERSIAATVGGLAAGVAAASIRPAARAVGQVVTLLHELGHTVVAAALGARPRGIVLRHDASGHATARWIGEPGPSRSVALAVVAFAGLPSAAVVGVAGVALLSLAGPRPVLWGAAAAGVVVTVLARSLWSLLVAIGTSALALMALRASAEPWAAGVVVALLSAIAIRTASDDLRRTTLPIHAGDDARVVGDHVRLPPRLVQLLQVALGTMLSAYALWVLAMDGITAV